MLYVLIGSLTCVCLCISQVRPYIYRFFSTTNTQTHLFTTVKETYWLLRPLVQGKLAQSTNKYSLTLPLPPQSLFRTKKQKAKLDIYIGRLQHVPLGLELSHHQKEGSIDRRVAWCFCPFSCAHLIFSVRRVPNTENQMHSLLLFVVDFDTCLVWELLLLPSNAQSAPNFPSLTVSDFDTCEVHISAY